MITKPKQINYGDWQTMPDYREGWVDPHGSGVGALLKAVDVGGYIPGLKVLHNAVDDATTQNLSTANAALSPVVKGINAGLDVVDPAAKWLKKNTYAGEINNFVENKPADTLGIIAATFFTAGAAGGAAAGAGEGAGAATGIGAGSSAAGSAAITPAFGSTAAGAGAGVTAGAGAGAITPAFGAAGLSIAPEVAAAGGLGAAGTAAAGSMLTPAFASWGGAGTGSGLLSQAKDLYGKYKKIDQYRSNIDTFAKNQPNEQARMDAQAGQLAERIIQQEPASDYKKKVANQIMMNKFGMRK